MSGGLGNDTYVVDNAGDVVTEARQRGHRHGAVVVTYTLAANVENLTLTGGIGDLNGYRQRRRQRPHRQPPATTSLDGGAGADTYGGRPGNDTYVVDNAGDVVIEIAGEGSTWSVRRSAYTLAANVENLTLDRYADLRLRQRLCQHASSATPATICSTAAPAPTPCIGGAGNDTYFVDNAGDAVTEIAGEGTDPVFSTAHFTLSANVENLILQGSADMTATATPRQRHLRQCRQQRPERRRRRRHPDRWRRQRHLRCRQCRRSVVENASEGIDTVLASVTSAAGSGQRGEPGADRHRRPARPRQRPGQRHCRQLRQQPARRRRGRRRDDGGDGNDTYIVDDAGDTAIEIPGEGTDAVSSTLTYGLRPTWKT